MFWTNQPKIYYLGSMCRQDKQNQKRMQWSEVIAVHLGPQFHQHTRSLCIIQVYYKPKFPNQVSYVLGVESVDVSGPASW